MRTAFVRHVAVGLAIIVALMLFTACSGLGNGQSTLAGSIVSVNASTGTVVISVNGQQDTISHVPTNVIQLLQSQVGHVYTLQVTTNSDGSFSIVSGSPITEVNNAGTPTSNETTTTSNQTPTTTNEPGSIEFSGSVQSASSNSLVVSMPTGSTLSLLTTGTTDLGDFNNALPTVNTPVKVKATANADGSFSATKIGHADSTNTSQVKFTGVTTAPVGSDRVLHFAVGNKSFSFPIASTADLKDFNGNAQSIQSGASVKVTVQFTGTSGTATDVGLNSGS